MSLLPEKSVAQCEVGLKLSSVTPASDQQKNGKIAFNVTATGSYECIISIVSGSGITEVEKKNSSGNQLITFENLEPWKYYQVLVIFNEEDEFLCKKRVLSDIIIEEIK